MKKEREIFREMLDFYLGRDDEMFSVSVMKNYNITPEEYVRIHSRFSRLLRRTIER